jgi:hypothetical protein
VNLRAVTNEERTRSSGFQRNLTVRGLLNYETEAVVPATLTNERIFALTFPVSRLL